MRRTAVAGALVVMVLVPAACGSSSKTSSGAATTASGATAPAGATTTKGGTTGTTAGTDDGTGTTAAGGGTTLLAVDPCAVLSDAEVTAAFAAGGSSSAIVSVKREKSDIASDAASCRYSWREANDSSSSFSIYVYGPDVYQSLKAAGTSPQVPDVPGAYKTPDGWFLGTPKATVSITGMGSDKIAAALLKAAVANAG